MKFSHRLLTQTDDNPDVLVIRWVPSTSLGDLNSSLFTGIMLKFVVFIAAELAAYSGIIREVLTFH